MLTREFACEIGGDIACPLWLVSTIDRVALRCVAVAAVASLSAGADMAFAREVLAQPRLFPQR